jgi:hypothetical protein
MCSGRVSGAPGGGRKTPPECEWLQEPAAKHAAPASSALRGSGVGAGVAEACRNQRLLEGTAPYASGAGAAAAGRPPGAAAGAAPGAAAGAGLRQPLGVVGVGRRCSREADWAAAAASRAASGTAAHAVPFRLWVAVPLGLQTAKLPSAESACTLPRSAAVAGGAGARGGSAASGVGGWACRAPASTPRVRDVPRNDSAAADRS